MTPPEEINRWHDDGGPANDEAEAEDFLIECWVCGGDGWYTDANGEITTCGTCGGDGWA